MDQDFKTYLDRQFTELRQEMDRRFDETNHRIAHAHEGVHKNRILIEKLNNTIQTVAEGVVANRETMHGLLHEIRQDERDFQRVIQAAHTDLERRVADHKAELKKLGRRVDRLEAARA